MKTSDALRAARSKIQNPEAWTKTAPALDSSGVRVDAQDRAAVCFSSYGAIVSIIGVNENLVTAMIAIETATPERFVEMAAMQMEEATKSRKGHVGEKPLGFGMFNDDVDTTHAEVLAAFDRAIEIAEGR